MSSIFLLLLLALSASAAQAEGTCSAVLPGPPGRDGRDGMPGTPGTCSYSDIQRIKEEIQRELEQSFRLTVYELFQNQTVGNCTQELSCKNETSDPSNDCPRDLGEMSNPAESCLQIYNCQPSSPSGGQYWIQTGAGENAVQIYCNLKTQLDGTRGWARVAYINMTEDGAQCPVSLRTVTENQKTICTEVDSNAGKCTSVTFAVQGKRYSKICGQAVGYEKGSPDAFQGPEDINSYYVDGISITYGSPRKHVWTYAIGVSDDYNHEGLNNCPCAKYPGPSPPSFVGDHYYCESGDTGSWDFTTFHSNDPLWDGDGCGADNNCCSQPGMPWFCRTLPQEVDEDIEMRVCRDEGSSNEKVYLELLEIYIQ